MDLEDIVFEVIGEKMRHDDELCVRVWESLTNIKWVNESLGGRYSFTFRTAGGLIADIIDRGSYMDWYCSGTSGKSCPELEVLFNSYGWFREEYEETDNELDVDGLMEMLDEIGKKVC